MLPAKGSASNFELPSPDLPSSATNPRKGSIAAQWMELEGKGLRSYTIGARVAAVIVNAKTGKTSLTPNELKMILSGQVRDWRALSVPDGQLDDNTIKLFHPHQTTPSSHSPTGASASPWPAPPNASTTMPKSSPPSP